MLSVAIISLVKSLILTNGELQLNVNKVTFFGNMESYDLSKRMV
jgi:hypothetical protein